MKKPPIIDSFMKTEQFHNNKWVIAKPTLQSFSIRLYYAYLVLIGKAQAVRFVVDTDPKSIDITFISDWLQKRLAGTKNGQKNNPDGG